MTGGRPSAGPSDRAAQAQVGGQSVRPLGTAQMRRHVRAGANCQQASDLDWPR